MIGTISINDVNSALPQALPHLLENGRRVTANSVANARPTIEYPGVFITEYTSPQRNVLFDPIRDANPFFHYLESLWIIAGRNDLGFLKELLPKMSDYSDDGAIFHGAYGYRLRKHWHGIDQVGEAINILRQQPNSRQVVMSVWDPDHDLGAITKDMPCNDMVMCKVREGRLNITVDNRSNDAVLGCYGANVVQFSMLQMYMAAKLDIGVGIYTQVSDSFHVYEDNPYWLYFLEAWHSDKSAFLRKAEANQAHYSKIGTANIFQHRINVVDRELQSFFESFDEDQYMNIDPIMFESNVMHDAACMWNALHSIRAKLYARARNAIEEIRASDWQLACEMWLSRREVKGNPRVK